MGFVRVMTKNNTMVPVPKWVFRSGSGLTESDFDSGERGDWLVVKRIKGIRVQQIDPSTHLDPPQTMH